MAEEPKPPYVQFEIRSVEDRQASLDAGHYVGKDVIFAIVTPVGTRDRIEREVTDWLHNIDEGVKQERIPSSWSGIYRRALEDFKESRETPEFGTPILTWTVASPSLVKTLLDIGVRTVEELAAANEETLSRIGMGARSWKEKAQAWLDSSKDTGKITEEVNALRVANEELKTDNEALHSRLTEMEKMLANLTPAKSNDKVEEEA